ncbi:dihydrofolate reductase [Catenibacillus scindens]|uniref:Dihydrofolate reductase n=1 Tax=Catenibacillus scindens TaxID=673271 RepID=A0A7W8HAQ0_9FIRM|nr:dihydrofolate reductase [Catenibacillus scindens]MBB5264222.1 dihydrofolate reductase [Catenibacillus scindens]
MNLIVAVDNNWAIGNKNKLLNSIPEDMKFFRTTTTGKVVIMGRKTLESFPGGMPLKKRLNIVISRQKGYTVKDAIVVPDIESALEEVKKYPTEDVYVIGGESIYRQMLPYCDVAHVTKMNYAYEADTWFPNLDKDPEWEVVARSEERTYFDLEYEFDMYVRKTSYPAMKDYIRAHCMDE